MSVSIHDLPVAPAEWQATPELRYQIRAVQSDLAVVPYRQEVLHQEVVRVLQQKWVEVHVYHVTEWPAPDLLHRRDIVRPTGKFEWRDVPEEIG